MFEPINSSPPCIVSLPSKNSLSPRHSLLHRFVLSRSPPPPSTLLKLISSAAASMPASSSAAALPCVHKTATATQRLIHQTPSFNRIDESVNDNKAMYVDRLHFPSCVDKCVPYLIHVCRFI
jgi:hypothetical protein